MRSELRRAPDGPRSSVDAKGIVPISMAPRILKKGVVLFFLVIVMPALAQEAAPLRVQWDAPEPLRSQLEKLLPTPKPEAGARRAASLRPWVRDVRRRVPEIAAAEGYFSATVDVD